ncbi:MAG TPA: hypothetical protein VNC50_09110 [Planctomycetia bacterium]|nr:hypothetical protein [Planctomycetia bacterium]
MLDIKRYLEGLLGVAPAAAGEDTQWNWRFHLGWPDWVLVVFGLAAAFLVVGIYLREGAAPRPLKIFLAGIRLSLVALLLLMLGELELSIDRTGLPYQLVAIDDSESMSRKDRPGTPSAGEEPPTRLRQVQDWLAKNDGAALAGLTERQKLRVYAHAAAARRVGEDALKSEDMKALLAEIGKLEPKGRESLLGGNVRTIINEMRGSPPSALILPTDGATTRGETLAQIAQYAARKQIPIFPIGVGDPERPRDLEVGDLLVDDTVFVGDDVVFDVRVIGKGMAGKEATLSLAGEGIESPVTQTVKIEADGAPVRTKLVYRPRRDVKQKTGTFNYVIEAPPVERELVTDNNKIEKAITFIDEKIRVLLVDTLPRYEFRFLKTLLDRQSTMEAKVLLLDADPEYVQQDRSAIGFFPADAAELAKFDVIVVGDVRPNLMSRQQQENVREFVRKGGGVMFVAGPQFGPTAFRDTPLEDLLPVRPAAASEQPAPGGFKPKLTLEGATSPIYRFASDDKENREIWGALPEMFWHATVEKLKPAASALLEHPTAKVENKALPLAAVQYYGAGRTYYQGFDGVWRWRHLVEDLYHARYWVQAMRYLSRAKLLGKNRAVELTVDRVKYLRGETVRLRAQFLDETKAPPAGEDLQAIIEKGGATPTRTTVSLKAAAGRRDAFEGAFAQTEDGQYRARLATPAAGEGPGQEARFLVLPPPGEMDDLQMKEDVLKELAKATGGRYFAISEADQLFESGVLPAGRRVAITADSPYPLWRSWPMLAAFLVLLTLEWLLRKRFRMV